MTITQGDRRRAWVTWYVITVLPECATRVYGQQFSQLHMVAQVGARAALCDGAGLGAARIPWNGLAAGAVIARRSAADTEVHPRDIFAALPARSSRYEYLRDVQREVFDERYERRSEGDLVIKMNTGNGKTLVGTADQHE